MSSRKRWQNKASYCKKGVAGKITNGGHSLKTTRAAGSRAVGQGWVGVGLGGIAGIKTTDAAALDTDAKGMA